MPRGGEQDLMTIAQLSPTGFVPAPGADRAVLLAP
jgi:hypothetical protein